MSLGRLAGVLALITKMTYCECVFLRNQTETDLMKKKKIMKIMFPSHVYCDIRKR